MTSQDRTNICSKCNRPANAAGHQRGKGWTHDALLASGYQTWAADATWAPAELEANGGHTPECERHCDESCPIGQERRREANRRAAEAQALWTARGGQRVATAEGTWLVRLTSEGDWGVWRPDGRGGYQLDGEVYFATAAQAAEQARWRATH